jgi:hypothetical protein
LGRAELGIPIMGTRRVYPCHLVEAAHEEEDDS